MAGSAKVIPSTKEYILHPVPFDSNNQHAPAADTDAVVVVSAVAGNPIIVEQITFSYSATPTGGSITINDGLATVWGPFPIVIGGTQAVTFSPPLHGTAGNTLTVTLAAGGGGITGTVAISPYVQG